MKKYSWIIIASIAVMAVGFCSKEKFDKKPQPEGQIEWLTIEQAHERMQVQPRKILMDVYTDWCGWCKVMDKNTFTNPAVANYINQHYYAVKFNAEQREDIVLGNQRFVFLPEANAHQLAIILMNGKMAYPTTVFLDETMHLIQPVGGYMDAQGFHQLITYFADNQQTKEPFDQYKTNTYPKNYIKGIN